MTIQTSKLLALAVVVSAPLWLAGCVTCPGTKCPEDKFSCVKKQDFATIILQPENQSIPPGKPAQFATDADGEDLSFQWYFLPLDSNVSEAIKGADDKKYSFKVNKESREGHYYCVIDSMGQLGRQRTQTRMAVFLMASSIIKVVYPPQSGTLQPSSNTGGSGCPANTSCCGWIYYGNGTSGFRTTDSTKTKCVVKLFTDANCTVAVPMANYGVLWRSGASSYACMTDSGTNKTFTATVNVAYGFTAYLLTGCGPANTKYYLTVDFQ